jgi:hypothetical protein
MSEITKIVYSGKEGSGKSLEMASVALRLVYRNAYWLKKTGVPRPIVSNMLFSQDFHKLATSKGIPIIYYSTLAEMIQHTECDIFIDELAKYFSARLWQDLSMDAIAWITQGGKQGVTMYASTQDFSQIEKTFRLLTSQVFVVEKKFGSSRPSKSRPASKYVWGVYSIWNVRPSSFRGDDVTMEQIGWLPKFKRIRRKHTKIYDTSQKIPKSPPLPLEHIVRYCPDPTCKLHIGGKITHK